MLGTKSVKLAGNPDKIGKQNEAIKIEKFQEKGKRSKSGGERTCRPSRASV